MSEQDPTRTPPPPPPPPTGAAFVPPTVARPVAAPGVPGAQPDPWLPQHQQPGMGVPGQAFPAGTVFAPGTVLGPGGYPMRAVGTTRGQGFLLGLGGDALVMCLGLFVLVSPFFLFALGGGGNTERFNEQMAGVYITGLVVAVIGATIMTVAGTRRSRAASRARSAATGQSTQGRFPGA